MHQAGGQWILRTLGRWRFPLKLQDYCTLLESFAPKQKPPNASPFSISAPLAPPLPLSQPLIRDTP
jgi:hypothetical protein